MTRKRTFSLPDDVSALLDAAAPENASSFVVDALREKLARDSAAEKLRAAYGEPDPTAMTYWVQRLTAVSDDQVPSGGVL